MLRKLIVASAATLTLAMPMSLPRDAQAWPVFVNVRLGTPVYYPAPVVVAEPVTVVTPAPVYVPPPAPVVIQPAPAPLLVVDPPRHRPFHVQYRINCHEPWHEYAAYHLRGHALDAQAVLARRGFEARVVRY
jgi:hypothetical protein